MRESHVRISQHTANNLIWLYHRLDSLDDYAKGVVLDRMKSFKEYKFRTVLTKKQRYLINKTVKEMKLLSYFESEVTNGT